ncbi:hypothetical protein BJ508DRAFT_410273 [Ascobolus immersus RN42]|uniref:RING-type domain-containing protein n=1 Tax=Ascobolus immersus RN42 TaxID=1160509 RepID=A0A3N4IQ03_ASCIM|nr:hypothetical protein BJ508DRAFT_410273 [Ascobolus immersus RN42]
MSFPFSSSQRSSSNNTPTRRPLELIAAEGKVQFLNEALNHLNDIFPDVDIDVLRQMLSTFSEESKLQIVTEALLRDDCKEAKGRRGKPRVGPLQRWERFRSEEYKETVYGLLKIEFKGLPKSSIQAVLAENNYDYRRSKATLQTVASRSWRFSISTFFRRRKPDPIASVTAPNTGCAELDSEIVELLQPIREQQIAEDNRLSQLLDEAEHAAASELVECETCYGDVTWNRTGCCSEGHFVCYDCLTRAVQQGIYGQGMDLVAEKGSIRCMSAASGGCEAVIPRDILERALPQATITALDAKFVAESLDRCKLPLVRCPFCSYGESDELDYYRFRRAPLTILKIILAVTVVGPIPFIGLIALLLLTFLFLLPMLTESTPKAGTFTHKMRGVLEDSVHRIQRKRRGQRFVCQSEQCGKASCLDCQKDWFPFHKCYEDELDGARIYVERAMAEAVKRTCPECHVSFVKSDGCNKLTCPCGYIMCYVCRADIGTERYQHFCQHFRAIPGSQCTECDRCDLYAMEDEAAVIKAAAKKAEEEYFREKAKPSGVDFSHQAVGPGGKPVIAGSVSPRRIRVWLERSLDWFLDGLLQVE